VILGILAAALGTVYLAKRASRMPLWAVAGVIGLAGLALGIYEFVNIQDAFDRANRQLSQAGGFNIDLSTAFGGGLYLIVVASLAVVVGAWFSWRDSNSRP
jgi:hypothetical protein